MAGVVAAFAGETFLVTPMPFIIACAPIFLVMGLVCDSFASERERLIPLLLIRRLMPESAGRAALELVKTEAGRLQAMMSFAAMLSVGAGVLIALAFARFRRSRLIVS